MILSFVSLSGRSFTVNMIMVEVDDPRLAIIFKRKLNHQIIGSKRGENGLLTIPNNEYSARAVVYHEPKK